MAEFEIVKNTKALEKIDVKIEKLKLERAGIEN